MLEKELKTRILESPQAFPLLEALADSCFVLSRDGTILAANSVAGKFFQRPTSALTGKRLISFFDPGSEPEYSTSIARCFDENERQFCELTLRLPDGPHEIEASFSVGSPTDGMPAAFCLAILRDISEEKRKEIDLLRFSNVAHYTLNPLEITDVDGNLIYVNPAFERASGYSKAEIIGQNPNVFGSGRHPKSFWDNMWKTITSGNVWVGEVENRRRNGEPFLTHLLISPVVDQSGTIVGYFGVHRDITEQRRLEHQLFQAQKMESIGTLAAGIAHEVGNPLTSISSLVQVVQRTSDDDFTKEKLELIKHQVTRISRIIRDLVDFSRPSTYEIQLTDINKSVKQAVDIVRVGKKSKSIHFDLQLDAALPSIHLVPDQVEQVFINILINAVDAIFEVQQVEQRDGRITVFSRADSEHVKVTINDNGKGMSEEQVEKIFEPFFTTKGVGEGTGLGLWVSYGILKSFHGEIHVESHVGSGSSFTILLPLHSDN